MNKLMSLVHNTYDSMESTSIANDKDVPSHTLNSCGFVYSFDDQGNSNSDPWSSPSLQECFHQFRKKKQVSGYVIPHQTIISSVAAL